MKDALAVMAVLALVAVGCGDDASGGGSGGGGSGGGADAATTTATSSSSATTVTSGTTSGSSSTSSTGEAPECDGSTPTFGDPCTSPGLSCEYGAPQLCPDGTTSAFTQIFTCEAGIWALRVETDRDCCPGVPPPSGTMECRHAGQRCSWSGDEMCPGGGSRQARVDVECDGELWVTTHDLGEEACDDTSVCPVDPPDLYGTCDVDATCLHLRPSPCPEGEGYDILTYATCQGGLWMGAALAEGPACAACTGASLPTCNDEHRGVVCPLSYGEQTCVEPTGWQTGTVGTGRGLRECRDDGSWAGLSDYVDCSE